MLKISGHIEEFTWYMFFCGIYGLVRMDFLYVAPRIREYGIKDLGIFCHKILCSEVTAAIDDYAKDGGPEAI